MTEVEGRWKQAVESSNIYIIKSELRLFKSSLCPAVCKKKEILSIYYQISSNRSIKYLGKAFSSWCPSVTNTASILRRKEKLCCFWLWKDPHEFFLFTWRTVQRNLLKDEREKERRRIRKYRAKISICFTGQCTSILQPSNQAISSRSLEWWSQVPLSRRWALSRLDESA